MKSKNLLILLLCIAVCIMAIGYAALSTTLHIESSSAILSRWDVVIDEAYCDLYPGGYREESTNGEFCGEDTKMPCWKMETEDFKNINFTFELTQPEDKITCYITYKNAGNLELKLTHGIDVKEDHYVSDKNSGILIEFAEDYDSYYRRYYLKSSETHTVEFSVEYEYLEDDRGNTLLAADGYKAEVYIETYAEQV